MNPIQVSNSGNRPIMEGGGAPGSSGFAGGGMNNTAQLMATMQLLNSMNKGSGSTAPLAGLFGKLKGGSSGGGASAMGTSGDLFAP